ncbi:hypothetical protein CSC2_14100 [Clostridium zeae]|uniref:Butirosin biosynthesis protein H N-terminal domain-containing protein n=1 Tax=Clostridium zeae TaxID=2759022 RepID=A0ABQ1E867_9CLOT|nr:hypothetical protein [Clostridium zeae]GFZ30884.1 hypothetical protein CSC2_14100 [Clostridium zeae]
MRFYSDEIILSKYMQNYDKEKFTETVCFGLGCGLQFDYDSMTGVISPLRRNVIERFFQRMAYPVKVICIKESYSYPIKQIREYINNGCIPIIQFKEQYGLINDIDSKNNFFIQDYEGKQEKLLISEVLQASSVCRVFLIDNCFNEHFPSNYDLKIIYRSAIWIDASECLRSTSYLMGLREYDDYSDDMKYSLTSLFQMTRSKYADWLDKVSDELEDNSFSIASEKCRLIAELWSKYQESISQSKNGKLLLKDIYAHENELCKDLCNIVQVKI